MTNKLVTDIGQGLALMNSMINCGETHSKQSEEMVDQAFKSLKELEKTAESDARLKQVVILANNYLYFDDNSDFHNALWEILEATGIPEKEREMMGQKCMEDVNVL